MTDGGFVKRGRRHAIATANGELKDDLARVAQRRRGTTLGPRGVVMTTAGVADVDSVLGGGYELGTCALITTTCERLGERMFGMYFIAEGCASAHAVAIVREGGESKEEAFAHAPRRVRERAPSEDGGDRGKKDDDDGLRIAWQYRRYLKDGKTLDDAKVGASARGGGKKSRAPELCHRYDASKSEDVSTLIEAGVKFHAFGDRQGESDERWSACLRFVEDFVRETNAKGDETVGRVVVQPETPSDDDGWTRCARLVRALKGLTYGTNCVTVIILSLEAAPARIAALIRHIVDCAIDVLPLDGPTSELESLLPDPHLCVGLVAVRKLQFQGSIVSPLVRMDRIYALQMHRKRMAIKPLQLHPEEESKKSSDAAAKCGGGKGGLDDF